MLSDRSERIKDYIFKTLASEKDQHTRVIKMFDMMRLFYFSNTFQKVQKINKDEPEDPDYKINDVLYYTVENGSTLTTYVTYNPDINDTQIFERFQDIMTEMFVNEKFSKISKQKHLNVVGYRKAIACIRKEIFLSKRGLIEDVVNSIMKLTNLTQPKETVSDKNEEGEEEEGDDLRIIGEQYEDKRDYKNMAKYYEKAIEKGNVNAMVNYGDYFRNNRKPNKMKKYYNMAIEKGSIDAMLAYIEYYYAQIMFDKKIETNIKLLKKYLKMAAQKGNKDAIKIISEIEEEKDLTKEKLKLIFIKN